MKEFKLLLSAQATHAKPKLRHMLASQGATHSSKKQLVFERPYEFTA